MSDEKSAVAVAATMFLEEIILEKYLVKTIPESRQYSLKSIKKLTGYNFRTIKNYVSSKLFTIHKTTLEITDNTRLLSEQSNAYCKTLIKKLIFPSKNKCDEYIYNIGRLFTNSHYTSAEQNFINLMFDKFFCIINDNITIRPTSYIDLLKFNSVNCDGFYFVARDIYNAIIRQKLHVGDYILPFINTKLKNKKNIADILESSSIFDYFFNKNAVLKCDLNTNTNLLIKNFLNLLIYNLNDIDTKIILLQKLNSKYSIFISDKIFDDFE